MTLGESKGAFPAWTMVFFIGQLKYILLAKDLQHEEASAKDSYWQERRSTLLNWANETTACVMEERID